MTDAELTRALERGEIANEKFHHLSHLHVAWVYLAESSCVDEAAAKMRSTLRKFAAAAGHSEKYHETITLFWIQLLGRFRAANIKRRLEDIVHAHPQLLEKDFPLEYYSRETLFSNQARTSWIEPDLKPLPTDATPLYSPGPTRNPPYRVIHRGAARAAADSGRSAHPGASC